MDGITREELQTEQRCDRILSPVKSWLESGLGWPKWEQISSLSPELKGYSAQFETYPEERTSVLQVEGRKSPTRAKFKIGHS